MRGNVTLYNIRHSDQQENIAESQKYLHYHFNPGSQLLKNVLKFSLTHCQSKVNVFLSPSNNCFLNILSHPVCGKKSRDIWSEKKRNMQNSAHSQYEYLEQLLNSFVLNSGIFNLHQTNFWTATLLTVCDVACPLNWKILFPLHNYAINTVTLTVWNEFSPRSKFTHKFWQINAL